MTAARNGVEAARNRAELAIRPCSAATLPDSSLVSVILPTRDRERFLRRALACALGQRDVEVEVIVVDDGSADGTPAYLRSVADKRVAVVRHESARGVAAARNAGLERARGGWVAFLDDDDLWAPDKLAAQLGAAAGDATRPWVCGGAVTVTPGLDVLSGWPVPPDEDRDKILITNIVPGGCSATMVRTDLVREVGGFDPELSTAADWDLWIRLADAAPWAGVQRPIVGYTVHRSAMSHALRHVRRELELVESKYRDMRVGKGLGGSRAFLARFEGEMFVAAGRRRGAVGLARSARRPHTLTTLGMAVAAAVSPNRLVRFWNGRGNPWLPGWREEAEGWLAGVTPLQ